MRLNEGSTLGPQHPVNLSERLPAMIHFTTGWALWGCGEYKGSIPTWLCPGWQRSEREEQAGMIPNTAFVQRAVADGRDRYRIKVRRVVILYQRSRLGRKRSLGRGRKHWSKLTRVQLALHTWKRRDNSPAHVWTGNSLSARREGENRQNRTERGFCSPPKAGVRTRGHQPTHANTHRERCGSAQEEPSRADEKIALLVGRR